MQMNFRKSMLAIVIGALAPAAASAHPGHAPLDFTAQLAAPFAGLDHFLAFAAFTALLLVAFGFVLKRKRAEERASRIAAPARVASRGARRENTFKP